MPGAAAAFVERKKMRTQFTFRNSYVMNLCVRFLRNMFLDNVKEVWARHYREVYTRFCNKTEDIDVVLCLP